MKRRINGGGLIIGLSTSNMMSVGLPGISGAPTPSPPPVLYAFVSNSQTVYKIDLSTMTVVASTGL